MSIFLSFCKASRMRRGKDERQQQKRREAANEKREQMPSLFVCFTADNQMISEVGITAICQIDVLFVFLMRIPSLMRYL